MMLISYAFVFVGSVCFSLGLLHLLIFFRRKDLKVELVFSFLATAVALSTFLELWTFKSSGLQQHLTLLKATLTVQSLLWITFGWFVYYYTGSKKTWPPFLITFLYCAALFINIISPAGILFSEVPRLTSFSLASGETFFIAAGLPNSFRIIADFAWVVLLLYTAFSCFQLSRKGNTRKAALFAVTVFLCLGLGYLHGTLIDFGLADPPYLGSFLFLPLSLVMSDSLAGDVVKVARLTDEIKQAEIRWRRLLENVNLMVLGIDHQKNIFYANPFFLSLTGYKNDDITQKPFITMLPENERSAIDGRLGEIFDRQSPILPERQLPLVTKSGTQREILWSSVLFDNSGNSNPGILSIGKDITDQVLAEEGRDKAIQELESLKIKLEEENISLKELIVADHGFNEIIGESDELLYVLNKIQQVAETDSTVLIFGETGTGKELVARAIHRKSGRSGTAFVRVNCAAIPANLVESELFGHEAGAFTDAVTVHKGKFELADGGTIFLDEISEMPLAAQGKLLNILQEREFERVGGKKTIPVDVRIISATNRDLETEITQGRFRADLFYRLNVYPISVPPLRDRKADIPLLTKHFIAVFNKQFGKTLMDVPQYVMDSLVSYHWPGNVRELRNILERGVITSPTKSLEFPEDLKFAPKIDNTSLSAATELLPLVEVERQHIYRALERSGWQISGSKGAARILQMNPSTLRSRMKKLNLQKP